MIKVKKCKCLKIALITSVYLMIGLTTGCQHKNPLINEDAISDTRNYLFFDLGTDSFPKECVVYFENHQSPLSLKSTCEEASQSLFNNLQEKGDTQSASVDDIYDRAFWKAVNTLNKL